MSLHFTPHPCECCLWLPQFQLCVLPKVARSFWCGWCSSPITSFSCTCVCLWGWGGVGRQRCNTLFTSLLISMTTGLNILLTYECFLCIVCVCVHSHPSPNTQDIKERRKDSLHLMWSLEGCKDIPSTKCKGIGHLCHSELVSFCSLNLLGF